ncbi:putative PHP domain-containing protein [Gottschalkia purinilytica]|uniref:Putative PHP domain-containing protein n=1 Tax=Gottschalkia purinilytica TaxID=1503 RepID=A0A0L0WBN5_GOTPU|nr:PHP domain-containing protein [Gottschalkia purinilytica]KNF08886.1 putative PHP domain-containing protein [Gottschalkia purinilytica]
MPNADLHIHTTASDGMLEPSEVVDWGVKKKLRAIAITDHDTVEGIERAIERAKLYDIIVIPGIEMSCLFKDEEVHILGYFIDYKSSKLLKLTNTLKESRLNRGIKIVEKLKSEGIDISIKEVKDVSEGDLIGRPHIARVLINKGLVESVEEAFNKYLGKGCPGYVERYKISVKESVDLIHSIGGAAVLAHPGLLKNSEYIDEIIKFGIDGVEVIHSTHSQEQKYNFMKLADKLNLIQTAGSDCHGYMVDGKPILGDFCIGFKQVELLKQKAESYR